MCNIDVDEMLYAKEDVCHLKLLSLLLGPFNLTKLPFLLSLEQDSMSAAFGAGDIMPSSAGVNAGSGSNADRKMMWGTTISFDEVMEMTTYAMDTSVRESGAVWSVVK